MTVICYRSLGQRLVIWMDAKLMTAETSLVNFS